MGESFTSLSAKKITYSNPRKFPDKIVWDCYLANRLKVSQDFQGLL